MKTFVVFSLSLTIYSDSFATATSVTASHIREIADLAREKAKLYGAGNVAVVFDFDNTLKALNQTLGSDQWFTWQAGLVSSGQDSPERVAKDINELVGVWEALINVSEMHPVEGRETLQVIEELRSEGFSVLIETSRGPTLERATMRELKDFGFSKAIVGSGDGRAPIPVTPQDVRRVNPEGLATFDTYDSRPVFFSRGLFMTAGRNKGIMLHALIKKLRLPYRAIVMADDTEKHCVNVGNEFKDSPLDVTTVLYTAEHAKIQAFLTGDKSGVVKAWERFQKGIQSSLRPEHKVFETLARTDEVSRRVDLRVDPIEKDGKEQDELRRAAKGREGRTHR